MKYRDDLILDDEFLARALAATAGVEWAGLRERPGRGKNYWIEEARKLFRLDTKAV